MMVNLSQLAPVALLLLPLVTAQGPQAELFDHINYKGESVTVPIDKQCHELSSFTPNLTKKVSSMKVPNGYYCAIVEGPQCSSTGVLKIRASTPSLVDQGWNDKIVSLRCGPGRKKSKGGRH